VRERVTASERQNALDGATGNTVDEEALDKSMRLTGHWKQLCLYNDRKERDLRSGALWPGLKKVSPAVPL
jgi:hypothetical protein